MPGDAGRRGQRVLPRLTVRASRLAGLLLAGTALAGCDANGIDYPDPPPVPPGATVVATADGSDNDDPMRGREAVVELGRGEGAGDLVAYYRSRFPASDGWSDGSPEPEAGGNALLCLVNHSEGDYDVYVEIYPYDDGPGRLSGPGRYLVWTSRLHVPSSDNARTSDRCGVSAVWFPIA